MKEVFYTFFALLFVSPLFARVICDTTCHAPEDEFRHFAVVSPVGRSMVTPILKRNSRTAHAVIVRSAAQESTRSDRPSLRGKKSVRWTVVGVNAARECATHT